MTERVPLHLFTKEMKETHTLLFPNMLPLHFQLVQNVLKGSGYKVELLHNCQKRKNFVQDIPGRIS